MQTNVRYLIERNLMNAGLVQLTPTLVDRYNEALISMGIEPTKRKSITIDGAGWSPQVAREKKNFYYLCNGIVNPTAIIVSPDQYKKPVYFPLFSWMRGLMRLVFEKYHREIFDITATHAISLDVENGLSSLEGPRDLLLLSAITVVPNTTEIARAAQTQRELIEHFMDNLTCLRTEARVALIDNREKYGDLRKRRLTMSAIGFDLFNDFYTVAFNGAAVLRGVGTTDLLVLENQSDFESIQGDEAPHDAEVCYLYDPDDRPFELLKNAGMIELPVEAYRRDPGILEAKRELLVSLSLCDCEEGSNWEAFGASKRKSLMKQHEDKLPKVFFELERFAAAVRRGTSAKMEISPELWQFLAVPAENLPPSTKEVLWILLTRKESRNILDLYTCDKNHFLQILQGWSEQKQKWVADYLAARYVPKMSQP